MYNILCIMYYVLCIMYDVLCCTLNHTIVEADFERAERNLKWNAGNS